MREETVTCDICHKPKQQTNSWFLGVPYVAELTLRPWTDDESRRPGWKHLCGRECVQKFVEQWMSRMAA